MTSVGVERGLIGPRETDRIWDRHIDNSLALSTLVPDGSTVVDVGSGAGLPGLPLALTRPDLDIILLEPLLRRATFLTEAVDLLGVSDRVRVVRARAEDHHGTYDVVASRAVAPLDRLARWCAPLRRSTGVILALKGRSASGEVETAAPVLRDLRLAAEVIEIRARQEASPATVVRLSWATGSARHREIVRPAR